MSCSLKSCVHVPGSKGITPGFKTKGIVGCCISFSYSQFRQSKSSKFPVLGVDFLGQPVVVSDQNCLSDWTSNAPNRFSVHAQASLCVSRAMRWWEKTLKPNIIEIHSAQELVDSLLIGGDRLVIVDFYSPGCGGCRALHPKICQLADSNPNVIFLKVNYEQQRNMCQSLNVHVLPFFKFYRGPEGHVCSFSCTNATIKKFKDALAKYGVDRSSLGPAKGLSESELLKLASAGELSINLPLSSTKEDRVDDLVTSSIDLPGVLSTAVDNKVELSENSALV